MTPTPRSDGSPPSAPVDQAPPVGGSIARAPFPVVRGTISGPGNGTRQLLSQPFIVENIDDGEEVIPVVSPLKFLRFDRDSGCVVDGALHAKPSSLRSKHDPE